MQYTTAAKLKLKCLLVTSSSYEKDDKIEKEYCAAYEYHRRCVEQVSQSSKFYPKELKYDVHIVCVGHVKCAIKVQIFTDCTELGTIRANRKVATTEDII